MKKSVSKEVWVERMQNLNNRRAKAPIKNEVPGIDSYSDHIRKGIIGRSVLDIGCGSAVIKKYLPVDVQYTGLDPFPQVEAPHILKGCIEDFADYEGLKWETGYCFAALDNVMDFKQAIQGIKRTISGNMMFLTGVNIEPDQYHTIGLTADELVAEMAPEFDVNFMEYLHPRIILVEFIRKA